MPSSTTKPRRLVLRIAADGEHAAAGAAGYRQPRRVLWHRALLREQARRCREQRECEDASVSCPQLTATRVRRGSSFGGGRGPRGRTPAVNGPYSSSIAAGGAAQQQSAAAHVAAADEGHRIAQAIAEDRQQDVDILPAGDAAEQHDLRASCRCARESAMHVTLERRRDIRRLSRLTSPTANSRSNAEREWHDPEPAVRASG